DGVEAVLARLVAERLDAAEGGGAVEGDLAQALERGGGRRAIADERGQGAGVAEDGGEHVAEVVGDAARQGGGRADALVAAGRGGGLEAGERARDAGAERLEVGGFQRGAGAGEQRQQTRRARLAGQQRQLEALVAGAGGPCAERLDVSGREG